MMGVNMEKNFVLRIGDILTDNRGREGIIECISISMTPFDPAGESPKAANVEEYHTEMGYQGAVSFGHYWCYFTQIREVRVDGGWSE